MVFHGVIWLQKGEKLFCRQISMEEELLYIAIFPGGKTTPFFSWERLQGGKASIEHYYYTKIS